MSQWREVFVHDDITQALEQFGFSHPMPIQSAVLPTAIRDYRDVLGAAPTGSGKTFAYGIPMLMRVKATMQKLSNAVSEVHPSGNQALIKSTAHTAAKQKRRKVETIFENMACIEELDAETGVVRAVHSILSNEEPAETQTNVKPIADSNTSRVLGLVLVPTRELAVQVTQHLRMLTKFMSPVPRIETIVGGISTEKQRRLLRRHPEVLVSTPGRLWQFIEEGEAHVCTARSTQVLVVDEVDRLVEANHFEDLRRLFIWLNENSDMPHTFQTKRQTMVFSATLTFVHRGALRVGLGAKGRKHLLSNRDKLTTDLKLDSLKKLVGLRPNAKVVDLSSSPVTSSPDAKPIGSYLVPDSLHEYRLLCPNQRAKDVRLFWFLAFGRYASCEQLPALENQRVLIFLNSKSGVRRLHGLLRQLVAASAFAVSGHANVARINVLHADMMQKRRFRSLEQFQSDKHGILIASDLAARGLDIASLDEANGASTGVAWVVHFEVPRTAELYVHRSGRTARADRTGSSVVLLSPNEMPLWNKLAASLKRSETDLDDFPVEATHYEHVACERIVSMASELDVAEHAASRRLANEAWFTHAAKHADMGLDSDFEDGDNQLDKKQFSMRMKRTQLSKQFKGLRRSLSQLVQDCQKSLRTKPRITIRTNPASIRKQLKRLGRMRSRP